MKPLAALTTLLLLLTACGGPQTSTTVPTSTTSSTKSTSAVPGVGFPLPSDPNASMPVVSSGGSSAAEAYNITLNFVAGSDPRVLSAMQSAAARWEGIITQGLPSVSVNLPANACGSNPAYSGTVDDILVFAGSKSIDGPGGVLALSGPCSLRSSSGLTAYSVLIFDRDDLNDMAAQLPTIALHELGHSLGIGSLWKRRGLTTGAGTSDPRYSGTLGQQEYAALGGTLGQVPEENQGSAGTVESHWRETTLGNELMTGYLNRGSNPLSRLSIASLQDLGYSVDYSKADSFAIGSINSLSLDNGIDIGSREIVIEPKWQVH